MLEKGGNLLLYEPSSGACLQEMRSTGGQAEWVSGRMLQDDEYLRQGECISRERVEFTLLRTR
jgi:hypothetical protein